MVAATVISVAPHELTEGMVHGRNSHWRRNAAEVNTEPSPPSTALGDSAILVGLPLSLFLLSPPECASNPPVLFLYVCPLLPPERPLFISNWLIPHISLKKILFPRGILL